MKGRLLSSLRSDKAVLDKKDKGKTQGFRSIISILTA